MHDFILPTSRRHRLFASRKHPDQAAILARIPLLRRRVPMRGYWKRQPVRSTRALRHAAGDAGNAAKAGGFATAMGIRSLLESRRNRRAHRHETAERRRLKMKMPSMRGRVRRPHVGAWPMLGIGATAGLLGMYYFDPYMGRRRRALMRDKFAHLKHIVTRDVPHRIEQRGRFFGGVAKGVAHHATDALPFGSRAFVDNDTLVARVRSEVLRDQHVKAGEIRIDAYEGCVTLRGQLDRPEEIRKLVNETAHVDGVREVRNFLHLPGTPPPNKAEVYSRYNVGVSSR